MDPADENLPALSAALAEKEAAYNDNLLTIAQTEAEITVEKSTLEADMAAAGVTAETLPNVSPPPQKPPPQRMPRWTAIDALLASQGTRPGGSRRFRGGDEGAAGRAGRGHCPAGKQRWKNWITGMLSI